MLGTVSLAELPSRMQQRSLKNDMEKYETVGSVIKKLMNTVCKYDGIFFLALLACLFVCYEKTLDSPYFAKRMDTAADIYECLLYSPFSFLQMVPPDSMYA